MRKGKIKVALLWSKYSGNVTSVNDLALGLDKEHFNIVFIYLSGHGVDENFLEEAGYEVFYLSRIKRLKMFRISILRRLVKILKEHNIDILHCHAHKPTVYGAIAGMLAKTPVVMAHVHGLRRSRNLKRKVMNFLLFRRINRIIPVAESVKKDVLRNNWLLSADKLLVLENSIDYSRFADVSITREDARQMLGLPSDAVVYGTVARFGPYKGHVFLVGAFEKVKKQIPSAYLILVGNGPLKEKLQQQVAQAGLGESVRFFGRRDDVPSLLRAMDVFVLPSVGSEGMPRVILEAMAANVPCVATDVGGIPEVINDQDVGFIVPPRDPEALAQAMVSVVTMPQQELGKLIGRARDRVRKLYCHEVVRAKLAKLYEDQYILQRQRVSRKSK